MRIARFTTGEDPMYGVVTGEVDQFGQPDPESVVVALAGDPLYVGVKLLDQEHRLEDVRLLAPVLPRSKVVGIGRNYAAHAAELGNEVPAEPIMFLKPNTSVVGPGDSIFYPRQTQNLHFEGELHFTLRRYILRSTDNGNRFVIFVIKNFALRMQYPGGSRLDRIHRIFNIV